MPRKILVILFLFLSNLLIAQEWSEPVNISNMDGEDRDPDIAIDQNGTMHCVWEHKYSNQFRKIFYSFSTDNGSTWIEPQDVSQNDTLWMNDPHIVPFSIWLKRHLL